MKRYLLLMLLMCLLGSNALAQSLTYEYVDDNIDFSGYRVSWGNNNSRIIWNEDDNNDNTLRGITQNGNPGTRWFVSQANTLYNNEFRISVSDRGFNIGHDGGGDNDPSYLQLDASQGAKKSVFIHNLHINDKVTIQLAGGTRCYIMTNNTDAGDPGDNGIQLTSNHELTIVNDNNNGVLEVKLTNEDGNYPGIRFIGIKVYKEIKDPRFDYDPGYEEYDMYDEFTYKRQNNGNYVDDGTTIFNTNNPAGFILNGKTANYITFTKSKISANDRIAVDQSGTWRFNYGLRTPTDNTNDVWSNFSVCNLRVGDRVIVSYMGGPEDLVFSSAGNSETYNGCAAFADKWNDGVYHEGEDQYITGGIPVQIDWQRNEGTISYSHGVERGNQPAEHQLYYTEAYVIAENGHLDFGIKNGPVNRLVKIKIYSDHQAMMVDDYIKEDYRYTAHFNISGELQLKEHIMPGGLEIQVGNDNPNQHAIVVASQNDDAHVNPIDGYVSYVNAVDGYKIPGVTKVEDGENIYYLPKFDLVPGTIRGTTYQAAMERLPETGTYYVFKPEAPGTMKLKFKANSMNYYRWDYAGDAVYSSGGWIEQFDRPNEQTLGVACPYYLVTIAKSTDDNPNPTPTFTKLGDVTNGQFFETQEITLIEGYTYYLYGAWNKDDVFFNTPDNGKYVHGNQGDDSIDESECGNNIEWRPIEFNPDQTRACGVAELLWVDFTPNRSIFPLAKWVPNNTKAVDLNHPAPNPDDPTNEEKFESELADVQGYVDAKITVKKMSGNIVSCHPYIWRANPNDQEGKLRIDNIQFAEGKNPGGTILIKIGEPDDKVEPLYTLTIAYSADYNGENGQSGNAGRGHTWDYSTYSLNGLTWDNETYNSSIPSEGNYSKTFSNTESGYAVERDLGNYFKNYFGANINNFSSAAEVMSSLEKNDEKVNGQYKSLLFEEIDYEDDHGLSRSDWMFNYNLVNDAKLYDPIFVNKYDMEGDNADMVWDSEGMVFQTSSGQSGIFNEYGKTVAHSSEETIDPDRFIGIMEGGKFRIPWLMKDDRVIIRMGIGTLNLLDLAKFRIRNAYDAMHNEISESDDYIVGGSHWDGAAGDPYYRGCYHFFAKGDGKGGPADMVFEMKEGSLCKIYSVQIYRGDRIITNEIVDNADTENPFLLYSIKADPNETSSTNKDFTDNTTHEWALKYLGKEQQMANGTGKNSQKNEIIAQTGKYNSATPALTNNYKDAEDETSPVESFTYKHQLGEIGTFRMRGKDMEKNMNYVADYADHNVTIAYQETQKYPYTWDFTDVTGIAANVTNLFDPEEKLGETIESTTKPDGLTDAQWETLWNSLEATSYQKTSRDLSLWEVTSTNGDYMLRLNSQTSQSLDNMMEQDNIFETAKEIGGNQVWANGQIVPEMQGILLYTDNNNQNNGEWTIIQGDANNVGGLDFTGSSSLFKKIVVPNVPKDAAVYLRMKKLIEEPVIKYKFGEVTKNDDLAEIPTNSSIAKFYKVDGTNNDYIVALLNTNSSKTNLTFSLNGYRIHKMAVSTDPKKVNKLGWATESRARVIDPELTSYLTGRKFETYIVTSADHASKTVTLAEVEVDKKVMPISENGDENAYIIRNMNLDTAPSNTEPGRVKILNDGFHLFVPDMHDYIADREDGLTNLKSLQDMTSSLMKSQLTEGTVPQKGDGENVYNYVLTTETAIAGANGENLSGSEQSLNYVGFFRAQKSGVSSSGNQGYLPLTVSTNAKYSFVFIKDWEVPTAIEVPSENLPSGIESVEGNASYYNMNGQRLNGRPSKSGIYIVNGKKVILK